MDLGIQDKKIALIQWLSSIEDSTLIEKLIDLRNREESDWWDDTSEDEKAAIKNGLLDAENGKVKPHSEAQKLYEKWL
ncbi:MAG TPA: hypothetical protein DCY51_10340 [Bacteroidetes bacterium]|nr:hypothetical protein [Bacteroidota bacterium]